jgi:hypothetical protein
MNRAETIASLFHATYETLAPEHGYETREASAVPWDDVPANNKALMIATVQHMLDTGVIQAGALVNHITAKAAASHKHVWQAGTCVASDCPASPIGT